MGVNGLINTRQRKKYRCKIRRTWKPSSIYNRSIERKFAEIFDLILDRLLMYYEWNILHELKTIFDIFEVRKFFFFFVKRSEKFMIIWNGVDKNRAILDSRWITLRVFVCEENFILQLFLKCNDSEKKLWNSRYYKIYKIFKNQNDSKFFPSICTKIIYYCKRHWNIFILF